MPAQDLLRPLHILLIDLSIRSLRLALLASLDFNLFILVVATFIGGSGALVRRRWLRGDGPAFPFEVLSVRLSHYGTHALKTTLHRSAGEGVATTEGAGRWLSFEVGGGRRVATAECLWRISPGAVLGTVILDGRRVCRIGVGLL